METTKARPRRDERRVHEYDTARRFENVVVELGYDAKPLWDILRPMMDPETGGKSLEEFALAGKRKQRIELAGSYPADDPNAIRHVRGDRRIRAGHARRPRADGTQLDLRFLLEQGVLQLEHVGQPAPRRPRADAREPRGAAQSPPPAATCRPVRLQRRRAQLRTTSRVDLNGEHPRLTTPDGHPLVRGVSINPVVADSLLGRFVNPAFDDATQAKGMLTSPS